MEHSDPLSNTAYINTNASNVIGNIFWYLNASVDYAKTNNLDSTQVISYSQLESILQEYRGYTLSPKSDYRTYFISLVNGQYIVVTWNAFYDQYVDAAVVFANILKEILKDNTAGYRPPIMVSPYNCSNGGFNVIDGFMVTKHYGDLYRLLHQICNALNVLGVSGANYALIEPVS